MKLTDLKIAIREWEQWQELPQTRAAMEHLQAQIDGKQTAIVLRPLATADAVYEQEFNKGFISGLLSVTGFVETMLSNLRYEVSLKEKENDNVENEE